MRAFLILVRLRLKEVRSDLTTAFVYFGLPLMLLLITGLIFMKGPPFERRSISIVAQPGENVPAEFIEQLSQFPELRWQIEPSESIALSKLNSHSTNAVVVFGSSTKQIYIASSDELFGKGIQTILPGANLQRVTRSQFGYIHYLFPGLITWTIIVDGLFGMGYSMVHYRRNQFLKKLSLTPLSKFSFVAAQIISRSVLAFLQMLLMGIVATILFQLPLTIAGICWLVGLTLLGLLVFMGAGFALACAIKTEVNMLDTVNAVTVVIILVSEIFFSADELPNLIAKISGALPSTQLVRLLRTIVIYGDTDPAKLLPGLAVLIAWLIVTYTISVLTFRWYETSK